MSMHVDSAKLPLSLCPCVLSCRYVTYYWLNAELRRELRHVCHLAVPYSRGYDFGMGGRRIA